MQKLIFLAVFLSFFHYPQRVTTLKGTWEYRGGTFNGKISAAPKDYVQQRKYSDSNFEAFLIEKGEKTLRYEAGDYQLKSDTCLETQTYSLQPSKLKGITVAYLYTVRNDTLFLKAKLPGGAIEEDYWKRIK